MHHRGGRRKIPKSNMDHDSAVWLARFIVKVDLESLCKACGDQIKLSHLYDLCDHNIINLSELV